MTESGESVTQKEISEDFYALVPGTLQENELPGFLDVLDAKSGSEIAHQKQHVILVDNFYVQHLVLPAAIKGRQNLRASYNFILIQFCLSGKCTYIDASGKKVISFKPETCNLLYIPKGLELILESGKGKLELISIYLEKNFFLRHIPAEHVLAQSINGTSLEALCRTNSVINPKQYHVLHDIINCEFEGHLKKLYTQAKIIELLVLHVVQHDAIIKKTASLKQVDIDKMMQVKHIIESNISQSFSLSNLAKTVVTNEQYLKKHFKIVFGTTVFHYILCRRMEKAKEMLLTEDLKIAEVAEYTGYKYATHFTNAFKKYHGFLPHQLKTSIYFERSKVSAQ